MNTGSGDQHHRPKSDPFRCQSCLTISKHAQFFPIVTTALSWMACALCLKEFKRSAGLIRDSTSALRYVQCVVGVLSFRVIAEYTKWFGFDDSIFLGEVEMRTGTCCFMQVLFCMYKPQHSLSDFSYSVLHASTVLARELWYRLRNS
jgi:hypothetical protein